MSDHHEDAVYDVRAAASLADRLEPWLHAFVHRPAMLAEASRGPLRGMPVGVKDIIDTGDMPTCCGSPLLEGRRPDADAAIVSRLRALGAIMFGKTVTTEFAWRHPGPTVNPYRRTHTPGGSSSGSAAAVAAGIVPLALGTQTVGSIIRPAAFCGVVGFKPTHGTLPTAGVHPFSPSLDHVGLFARRVETVAHAFRHLVRSPEAAMIEAAMIEAPRLLLVRPREDAVSGPQRAVRDDAARLLGDAGATVSERTLPPAFDRVRDWLGAVLAFEAAAQFGAMVDRHPDRTSAWLQRIVAEGRSIEPATYDEAREAQALLRAATHDALAGFDALLMVPAPGEAPAGLDDTGDATFCAPWSFAGVPALTLPAGWSPNGLPLGLQLVGDGGTDARLLEVGSWAEARLGWRSRALDCP